MLTRDIASDNFERIEITNLEAEAHPVPTRFRQLENNVEHIVIG